MQCQDDSSCNEYGQHPSQIHYTRCCVKRIYARAFLCSFYSAVSIFGNIFCVEQFAISPARLQPVTKLLQAEAENSSVRTMTNIHTRKLPPNTEGGTHGPFISPLLSSSTLPLLPFSSLPSPPLRSPPLPSPPLEVGPPNPARGSGERCELPQRGLGRSPSRNRIRCILALNPSSGGNNF